MIAARNSGVTGQVGPVGGLAEQRDEPQPLLRADRQAEVLGEHVLIAAVLPGVGRRTAHDLGPPRRDVVAVLLGHVPAEHGPEQVIGLDAVIERVEPPPERRPAAGPREDRRGVVRGVGHARGG
jgi:hypothetical protein